MSGYLFFLSYARLDRDKYLKRFYNDLAQEVRTLTGIEQQHAGFFDAQDIEPGDEWPHKLAEGLQTSRVFVPLYSPTYFTREYCGKEWKVFRSRIDMHIEQPVLSVPRPSFILPVLWVPEDKLPNPLPYAVTGIQYNHDDFGEAYAKAGLRQLMLLKKYRDKYHEFVGRFADKIITLGQSNTAPPIQDLQPIKDICSAFHEEAIPVVGVPENKETKGPRYVQFIFVAGRKDELRPIRQTLDYYGDEGGMDWQPYLPDVTEEIAIVAQNIASLEKLRYEVVPLDQNLMQQLDVAKRNHKIVVFLIDSWSLRLSQYNTLMNEYDSRSYLNCIVSIPWNPKDDETITAHSDLEDLIQAVFANKTSSKDATRFLDSINSPEQLRDELRVALVKAKMRIIKALEVTKKVESMQFITKPNINATGGN